MKIDRFIFKSSHSFLTLRTSWLVWCLYRYYQGIFQNSASNRESWSWKSGKPPTPQKITLACIACLCFFSVPNGKPRLRAWLPSLGTGVRLRLTLLWYKPCCFLNANYFVIMLTRYWSLSQYISNSWGTNSLNINVVTTPTSTPHSNRVKFSNVLPSCGFSTEKALNVPLKY